MLETRNEHRGTSIEERNDIPLVMVFARCFYAQARLLRLSERNVSRGISHTDQLAYRPYNRT